MLNNIQSFDELKRLIYLFLLPVIFIAVTSTFVLRVLKHDYSFGFGLIILLLLVFIAGWIVAYIKKSLRFFEYLTIFIVIIYHTSIVLKNVKNHVTSQEDEGLGMFVIWMPLIIMYIFMVFKRWWAFSISIMLLILSVGPGIYYFMRLSPYFKESLLQLYISTGIYIIIIFFAQHVFRAYADIKLIRQQFYSDSLTQIGNRYQIDSWMKNYIKNANKDNDFSILFFDVDHFKQVNDYYGHKVGDVVLKEIAEVVTRELREGQYFGRWGGEEFIILVKAPECTALQMAERIRRAIERHVFTIAGTVTASFGVTGYMIGDTVDTILERGDERLYVSKKQGRNRVTGKN